MLSFVYCVNDHNSHWQQTEWSLSEDYKALISMSTQD